MDDENLDEDEESKMDPEEPDQMDEGQIMEDIDAVAPGPAPTTDIAKKAAVWAIEMVVPPDGFVVGEEELAEAIVEAEMLTVIAKVADDDLDEGDGDIEFDGDLMDDDEEIATNLPEEMLLGLTITFHPMSRRITFPSVELTNRVCCPLLMILAVATDCSSFV